MPIRPVIKFFKNPLAKSISFTILTAVIVIIFSFKSELLKTFELRTLDYRFQLVGTKKVESDLAVVFIRNEDIEARGRWPWPRSWHALLIEALNSYGADQIGFDILFTDPSPEVFKEDDEALALYTKEAGNVTYISFFGLERKYGEEDEEEPADVDTGKEEEPKEETGKNKEKLADVLIKYSFELPEGAEEFFRKADKHELPIPELLYDSPENEEGERGIGAAAIGYSDCLPDIDGPTRKVPLLVNYDGRLYMSFPLILVTRHLGITKEDITINPGESVVLKTGTEPIVVPMNDKGEMLVNFTHSVEDFQVYSFNQLLQSFLHPEEAIEGIDKIKGKIVIIGTTYTGGTDIRSIPIDPAYPFLCLQATVIDNILNREFIYRPDLIWRILIIIFFCFLINFLCSYTKPSVNFVITFLASVGYFYVAFILFKRNGLWLDIIFPLMAVILPYIIMTTLHYTFALFENIKFLERMKYLGNLVESSHDAIFSFDLDGNLFSWNSGAKQIYGYETFEVLGKPWGMFVPPDKEEALNEIMKKAWEGDSTGDFETNLIIKGGETIIANISASPILSAKGETSGVSIISQDLTEKKRLMEQIMESEKLAEIGRLSAGLAHEIKNPLTPIIYYAQSLEEAEEADLEEIQETGKVISSEANRILALAKDLLSFSRPKEDTLVEVDVNKAVDDTVLLIIYQARKLGAETVKDLQENLPHVMGEPDKLKQVLINLVMNAAHAMEGNKGTVKITTSVINEGGKDFIQISVEDDGSGMPEHVKKNLFQPFFTTKPKGEGTGLGLYISYNIIKQMDGEMSVESEDGVGTTFFIKIPVMQH
jgi:PAS domain S-box-containing protein